MKNKHQLLGWHLSYYTGKVLCYLRYKGIPFEGPYANAWTLGRQIPKRFGASVMPVVITPEGTWLQDSSAIIDHLETQFPQRSVHPTDPVARFASYLLEAWGDEWWIPVAMHSRWSYPENRSLFVGEAGQQLLPGLPSWVRTIAAKKIASKLESMLHVAGVRPAQFDVLEAWTVHMLDQLDTHFAHHDFLLGNSPSLGDFGLVGTFYGHLARDPWPLREWVAKRMHLHRWVERMAAPPPTSPNGAQWSVPETLTPVLRAVFAEFTQMVEQANAELNAAQHLAAKVTPGKLLRRVLGDMAIQTTAGTVRRNALPFMAWKAQRVLDAFAAMEPAAQTRVRQWAQPLGGERFLNLQIVRLQRQGLRVRAVAP